MLPAAPVSRAFTLPLNGTAFAFSPLNPNAVAYTGSENFGMVGGSAVFFRENENVRSVTIPNATFDVAFSEACPGLAVCASGDGQLRVVKDTVPQPIRAIPVTSKEVYSVEGSHHIPNSFLCANSVESAKIVDIEAGKITHTFLGHKGPVHEAHYHPRTPEIIASCGVDGTVRIWDIKTQRNVLAIPAHQNEVLSCDFNKYEELIATGSSDNTIKIFDLRMTAQPISILFGHRYPIKRVRFSPFSRDWLLSGSFDMSVKLWNIADPVDSCKKTHEKHHEFVQGIAWSPHIENVVASISWDSKVYIWNVLADQPFIPA